MTDTPDDSAWIGRSETAATDLITPRLINSFAATLAPCLAADAVAPSLHWCLSPPLAPASGLGADGHPMKGGFLPPIPLPRAVFCHGGTCILPDAAMPCANCITSSIAPPPPNPPRPKPRCPPPRP